jgi:hypothetical protein
MHLTKGLGSNSFLSLGGNVSLVKRGIHSSHALASENRQRPANGLGIVKKESSGRIQRKTCCMGPYAGADYNLILCLLRVDSNTFTMGNPMPESTSSLCQSRFYSPVRDLPFAKKTPVSESTLTLCLCRASMHSFFIDCQSLRELRITGVFIIATTQEKCG